MVICLCHRVSDRDIACGAQSGCTSFEALQDDLRVGTACGCCLEMAQEVFEQHAAPVSGAAARAGEPLAA
ncbi:MAG: (2Fe-2S)-binding protein [Burkholderiales bacterium]|nr:(2Fe-2S)-binding protein [Burkholderiales bacterium]